MSARERKGEKESRKIHGRGRLIKLSIHTRQRTFAASGERGRHESLFLMRVERLASRIYVLDRSNSAMWDLNLRELRNVANEGVQRVLH